MTWNLPPSQLGQLYQSVHNTDKGHFLAHLTCVGPKFLQIL